MAGTLVVGTLNNGTSPYNLANLGQTTAKAWVNFTDPGTSAITASYNVSSVTDVSTGRYKIKFVSPLASDSYCVVGSASQGGSAENNSTGNVLTEDKSTSTTFAYKKADGVQVCTVDNNSDTFYDSFSANVVIFAT